MQGGKKGLLINSEAICSPQAKTHAVASTAQNGKLYHVTPAVANRCANKKHSHAHKPHR